MIAGGARSGTTWLAELVASRTSGRLVFEPFQSEIVSAFKGFHYFQYMRPHDEDARLLEFSKRVFSGRIRDPWVDKYVEVIRPRTRVVKEIRANLMLRWLHLQFPSLPLVFIIRHPCAVVASRLALRWPWERDLESMLAQDRFRDDFLSARAAAIEAARSPVAKHALIWCLTHAVPLSQFPPAELWVVFHEDLCLEPERQLGRVFARIGHPQAGTGAETGRASMTARSGSGVASVDRWRQELSREQIDEVRSVVDAFGLDYLYADGNRPTEAARRLFGVA
ncbi:MAG: sulfotransferase [Deltaproteobacteria bacterium]|nr:sulfotransferase [Deltaproteobacteria bacterium]